ncbi:hypothetical protein FT637_15950 [Bacillus cereus]|nr:hypothetical protein [Bacillus cereus]
MDTFTRVILQKLMLRLISRVRHYLTITRRSPPDKRSFFYSNNDFVLKIHQLKKYIYNVMSILFQYKFWLESALESAL